MPVRFKDTAEYHQRFSPKVAQKLQTNSNRVSDLSSGNQPLVSILKTSSSVLPTRPDDGRGNHSEDYVLLGSQSKFAPSVRYRLRPTAIHHITPPLLSLPPPLHPPPHQEYTDASLKSLRRKEVVGVRGQSSFPGKDDVEGSVLIGQRMNSRRSQGSQSNAVGDSAEEVVGRDRKTAKNRLIGLDEKKKDGLPLTGITMNDDLKRDEDEGHCLGKTYNVGWRRRRRSGSPLSQNDSFPRSLSKQQRQQQQQELHRHHHQRDDDDDELNFSKDGQLRLNQATQTNERSHRRRSGMEEEESNDERQGRRRRRTKEEEKEEQQEDKENRHSRSDDNRPISLQDGIYRRNRNNNSNSTANQKTMLNYDDSRKKEKPGAQREPSGETYRGRETEATEQKGRETEATGHNGRRTEPESVVSYKVKGQHYARDRTKQKNAEEMKSKKKSDERIQQRVTSSSSSATHPPPPLPLSSHLLHHHAQQQHLQPKRSHARETELKSFVESSRRSSGGEGIVGGRMMRRDGKTSSSDVETQRDAAVHHPVTSSVHHLHHHLHDESTSSEDKRNSASKEEEEKKKRSMRDRHQSSSEQMMKSTVSNVTSTKHNVEHTRLNTKQHLPPSSSSSKAEHTSSSSSHATSVLTRDETTQTKSDAQTTMKREDGIQQQQQSLKSFGHLKNQHPSNHQMQLLWKQQPVTEAFVEQQQQQQPTSASQHQHPHRSASVISLSHPDFRTLFASHRKVDDEENTEYRFQFRPISARNNQNNDRRNFDSQPKKKKKNEMRRGHSLGDLSMGERDEKNMEDRRLIIVRHDDQPKKYRSEYTRNFQPPWNYQFEDGTWKEMEKRKRRNHSSQVAAAAAIDDDVEKSSNHNHHHLVLQSSSSSASSWFEEVLELRRHADEYRRRANGTHFSREELKQFYAGNVDSRGDVTEVNDDINDCNDSSRRRDDNSFIRCDGKRTEDERRRRRMVIEDGGRGERTMDDGGEGGSGGRPLRHHFDRTSHKHHLPPHHPHHHLVRQQQPHISSAAAASSSGEDALYDDSESSTAATVDADHLTSRHCHEDKGVQIELNDGKAFQQSNQHRKILSSSSLASKVLERARNRNDEFWSK